MAKSNKKNINQVKDLIGKSITELKQILTEAQNNWVGLRMEHKIGKLKDVHSLRKKRKEIARIKTVIKEKELKEGGT